MGAPWSQSTGWTDDRIEALKSLWAKGLSASMIAGELGGVSRNSVLGKVHRLGLAGRQRKVLVQAPRKPRAPRRPRSNFGFRPSQEPNAVATHRRREALAADLRSRFEAVEVVDLSPDESACAVRLVDLARHQCKWPLGDPRDLDAFRFCGADRFGESSYCQRHSRMAYQPRRAHA